MQKGDVEEMWSKWMIIKLSSSCETVPSKRIDYQAEQLLRNCTKQKNPIGKKALSLTRLKLNCVYKNLQALGLEEYSVFKSVALNTLFDVQNCTIDRHA